MQTVCPPARRLAAKVIAAVPAVVDFCLYSTDDFSVLFQFRDEDDEPLTMTADWLAQIRTLDGTLVQTFTIDDSGEVGGDIVLSLTNDQVATLTDGLYFYDIHWTPATGPERTWIKGCISTTKGISVL